MDPGYLLPAYIDPGSGSFMLQVLVGGALGALVAVKMYWTKCVAAVRSLFTAKAGS